MLLIALGIIKLYPILFSLFIFSHSPSLILSVICLHFSPSSLLPSISICSHLSEPILNFAQPSSFSHVPYLPPLLFPLFTTFSFWMPLSRSRYYQTSSFSQSCSSFSFPSHFPLFITISFCLPSSNLDLHQTYLPPSHFPVISKPSCLLSLFASIAKSPISEGYRGEKEMALFIAKDGGRVRRKGCYYVNNTTPYQWQCFWKKRKTKNPNDPNQ